MIAMDVSVIKGSASLSQEMHMHTCTKMHKDAQTCIPVTLLSFRHGISI